MRHSGLEGRPLTLFTNLLLSDENLHACRPSIFPPSPFRATGPPHPYIFQPIRWFFSTSTSDRIDEYVQPWMGDSTSRVQQMSKIQCITYGLLEESASARAWFGVSVRNHKRRKHTGDKWKEFVPWKGPER